MEKINDLLNINNLKIVQNDKWFNFSIDSVLLANFVNINNKMKIIDFCTGNAPIPLILSQKTKNKIIGVELQKEIYDLAVKSVKLNSLDNKIQIINENINNLKNIYETDTFDLITCNPPYFKTNKNNFTNENKIKAIARHEIYLELDDIFNISKKLLKNNGKVAIIHRTERLIDIIISMKKNNIEPKRIKLVYPFENSNSNLVLVEGVKNGKPGLKFESNIIIHNNDLTYKKDIIKMFGGIKYEN